VYARQISQAAISALENNSAAHSRFNGYQYIITVNTKRLTGKIFYRDTALSPGCKLLVRARASHDSQSLSFGEREFVTHQLERALFCVSFRQQQ
jgi:hypothetical protein